MRKWVNSFNCCECGTSYFNYTAIQIMKYIYHVPMSNNQASKWSYMNYMLTMFIYIASRVNILKSKLREYKLMHLKTWPLQEANSYHMRQNSQVTKSQFWFNFDFFSQKDANYAEILTHPSILISIAVSSCISSIIIRNIRPIKRTKSHKMT